jgi:hypothetical protein
MRLMRVLSLLLLALSAGAARAGESPTQFGLVLAQAGCSMRVVVDGVPVVQHSQVVPPTGLIPITSFVSGGLIDLQVEVRPTRPGPFVPGSGCGAELVAVQVSDALAGRVPLGRLAMLTGPTGPRDTSSPEGEGAFWRAGPVRATPVWTEAKDAIVAVVLARQVAVTTGQPLWRWKAERPSRLREGAALTGLLQAHTALRRALEAGDAAAIADIEAERREETGRAWGVPADRVTPELLDVARELREGAVLRPLEVSRLTVRRYADERLFELVWATDETAALQVVRGELSASYRLLWRWDGRRFVLAR